MIDLSYYLPKDKGKGTYSHVVEYPQGKLAEAEDLFYWEKIYFGQEPTIRLNHVTLFPQAVGAVKFLAANKQVYSSRYMRVAQQLFYCVPDTEKPVEPRDAVSAKRRRGQIPGSQRACSGVVSIVQRQWWLAA